MDIQRMTRLHLNQIAELERICFSDPWSIPMLEPELSNPLSLWLVMVEQEQVIGYVGSQAVLDAADMMNIAVHPAYRRLGIARQLVQELVAQLKQKNICSLTLEVRASNAPAICLYEKLGFLRVGRRPGYYRKPKEDAFIMRKEWGRCESCL